ncbi:MAG: hypothetical protein ACRC46_05595 [Thermoguttaceae bacterium]
MLPFSSQYDTILREAVWTVSCEIVGHSLHPNRNSQRSQIRESLDLQTSPLPTVAAWLQETPTKNNNSATTRPTTALQSLWEQLGVSSNADDRKQRPNSATTFESILVTKAHATVTQKNGVSQVDANIVQPQQRRAPSRLKRRDAVPQPKTPIQKKQTSTITYESAFLEQLLSQRETV